MNTSRLLLPRIPVSAITMFYNHFGIIAISLVIALLAIGIVSNGSPRALTGMLLFASSTGLTYWVMVKSTWSRRPIIAIADHLAQGESSRTICIWLVGLTAITSVVVHFVAFDGLTLGSVLKAQTNLEVALIRMNVTKSLPVWMHYLNSITVNTLLPISLLLAIKNRLRLLAIIIASVGILYTICMMQKSGPVILALPTIVYFICTRRLARALIGIAIIVTTVYMMDLLSNPSIKPKQNTATIAQAIPIPELLRHGRQNAGTLQQGSPTSLPSINNAAVAKTILGGLAERVLMVPGDVVVKWFETIPTGIPHAFGCGYRFLTTLLGCDFKNFSVEMYNHFYPDYAKAGLHGTVNAASMMTAYANFGMPGIVISGVLHGLLAWIVFVLFSRTPALSPAFNVPYLLFLSSGDLFTILLSGGWGLAIILYVTLCRPGRPAHLKDSSFTSNATTIGAEPDIA